tara:strand:+ start:121 stop:399 length:279 start_codon:yes stop_codon:yes gene_type:complete
MSWSDTEVGGTLVTEPSAKQVQLVTYIATTAVNTYTRTVTTTKKERRGLSYTGAGLTITAQADNSPEPNAIGAGGWNVRYVVIDAGTWTLVT